jgi:hypothetical protein
MLLPLAHLAYDSEQLEVVELDFRVLKVEELAPLLALACRLTQHLELTQEGVKDTES